jgi:rhamnulokinase
MKPVYYLAVDIGASSGRHILASMDNGRMVLEEVYRFENGMVNTGGKKLWDVDKLYENILEGMKECKRLGKIPVSMSIDTWAVDYVSLMIMISVLEMFMVTGMSVPMEWIRKCTD